MLQTTDELSKQLSVHRNTIYRMVERGEIPQKYVVRIGSQYRFNSEAIMKYLLTKSAPDTKSSAVQQ